MADYKLVDFYDVDADEPTDRLVEIVREGIRIYENNTSIPLAGVYLVGGIVLQDTSEEGRKDVDMCFEPAEDLDPVDAENLYFVINNTLQAAFGERYEVFVEAPWGDRENIDLTGHFL